MMDSQTTIETLKKKAVAFRDARNWRQFHDAKNLASGAFDRKRGAARNISLEEK